MHPTLTTPYVPLTRENCTFLLIDHQMGLMLATQSMKLEDLRRATLGFARVAKLFGIPTVITSGGTPVSGGRGFNGPLFPELTEILPDAPVIERTALNAWAEPRVVEAVEKTGRKKLLMGGVSSDVCLTFATVAAADVGYEVYFVTDVSTTWDTRAEVASMLRMTQRGVVMTNWRSVAAEIQADYAKHADSAEEFFAIMGEYDAAFQGVAMAIAANGGRLS